MRTLAVDPGSKRIGLAISDEGGTLATPYDVLEVSSGADAVEKILGVMGREQIERVVMGLPLNMDDSAGPGAREAIRMGRELGRRSGKEVLYIDERLSSFDAEQKLIAMKQAGQRLTRRKKKERLDALAAAAFLRDFLEGGLRGIEVEGLE